TTIVAPAPAADRRTVEDPPPRSSSSAAPAPGDITRRVAGLGALGFAGTVVLQNALRAGAPQPGADTQEIATWFTDHRAVTVTLLGTFVVALVSLAVFIGGTMRQLLASSRRGWAIVGWVGAGSIIALFASVVAAEQGLSVVAA